MFASGSRYAPPSQHAGPLPSAEYARPPRSSCGCGFLLPSQSNGARLLATAALFLLLTVAAPRGTEANGHRQQWYEACGITIHHVDPSMLSMKHCFIYRSTMISLDNLREKVETSSRLVHESARHDESSRLVHESARHDESSRLVHESARHDEPEPRGLQSIGVVRLCESLRSLDSFIDQLSQCNDETGHVACDDVRETLRQANQTRRDLREALTTMMSQCVLLTNLPINISEITDHPPGTCGRHFWSYWQRLTRRLVGTAHRLHVRYLNGTGEECQGGHTQICAQGVIRDLNHEVRPPSPHYSTDWV